MASEKSSGFDDLLAAYDMPDMATILAGNSSHLPTSNVAPKVPQSSTTTCLDVPDGPKSRDSEVYAPLMANSAVLNPMHPSVKLKSGIQKNPLPLSGVSQVARNPRIWEILPQDTTCKAKNFKESTFMRSLPTKRIRRPQTCQTKSINPAFSLSQNYQSFNITKTTSNTIMQKGSGLCAGPSCSPAHVPSSAKILVAGGSTVSLLSNKSMPPVSMTKSSDRYAKVTLTLPIGNKLLSKSNPLPAYKPPKPPAHLGLPNVQFKCGVCEDAFLFKTSLESHIKRRSMLITFTCRQCAREMVFYNKCAFHTHLQAHLVSGESVNVEKSCLKVEPISFELIKEGLDSLSVFSTESLNGGGPLEDDLSSFINGRPISSSVQSQTQTNGKEAAASGGSRTESPSVYKLTVQRQPSPSDKNAGKSKVARPARNPSPMQGGKFCFECYSTSPNTESFLKHFTNDWKMTADYPCARCGLCLPTACSLKAHIRLSKGYSGKPFVCPECGETFSLYSNLVDHVKQECFHYARTLTYPCPICQQKYKIECCKRFNDRDAFKKHFASHSDAYYKCKSCPMAFKSETGLVGHYISQHPQEEAPEPTQLMIYKCPMCNTVFHQGALLSAHLSWHFDELEKELRYEFLCPLCMVRFGTKKMLIDHVRYAHHKVTGSTSTPPASGRPPMRSIVKDVALAGENAPKLDVPDDKQSKKTEASTSASPISSPKPESGKDEVKEPTQKKRRHKKTSPKTFSLSTPGVETSASGPDNSSKSALATALLSSPTGTEEAPESETTESIKGQYAPYECPICHTQYFYRDSLFKHRRIHEKEGKFICLLCSEVFNNKVAQVQHTRICFRIKKGMDSANTKVNMYTCEICDETFFIQDELQKHMQELHSISVLQQFACLLCGLTYDEKSNLTHHIEEAHKGNAKKHTFMCWICQDQNIVKGFPKRHMLEKHLQIQHKIAKNQIDYSKMPSAANGDTEANEPDPATEEEKADVAQKRPSDQEPKGNPVKRLKVEGDTVYNCAKCKYSSDDREQFQKHIAEHKNTKDCIQCLECGMCFIVEPSLRKHLFVVHKIKDYKKYISDNGIEIPTVSTEQDMGHYGDDLYSPPIDVNPLECKVCYRIFEEEARLKNHMRTHGMAFIRSKRVNSSLSTSSTNSSPTKSV